MFRVTRPYGTFLAILGTYGLSALLHGLNFQLGIVLVSLGFYTYTEHVTRQKLASIFSACIKSRKCGSDCDHQWKENHWSVRLVNICFSSLAIFHLAYLGLMFDSSKLQEEGYSLSHALKKWHWLNFSSHWLMLGTFIFYWLVWMLYAFWNNLYANFSREVLLFVIYMKAQESFQTYWSWNLAVDELLWILKQFIIHLNFV